MGFTIKNISTYILDHVIRQDRVVVSSAGRHDHSRFLVVKVEGADGVCGWGEAATTALWNGETAETAQRLVDDLFAPPLKGATLDHPSEGLDVMAQHSWGNPFAKAAVDTALWDLWCRLDGVPATSRFADREPVEAIPTRASIGAYPVEKTVEIACAFWKEGIRTLKFKTGVPAFDDVARLSAVRERLGSEPVFTIDDNGGHASADDAVRAIEALLPFNIELAEQPTPRDRLGMLAEVKRRVQIPILADEAVFTPGHLTEALDLDAFDLLSVYPGKNGGFTRSIEMVRTAAAAGKRCSIGSNLETDLGQAAMAALAAGLSAFPVEEVACDLPGIMYYVEPSVDEPLRFKDGRIRVPAGPGFGVRPVGIKACEEVLA